MQGYFVVSLQKRNENRKRIAIVFRGHPNPRKAIQTGEIRPPDDGSDAFHVSDNEYLCLLSLELQAQSFCRVLLYARISRS